MWQTVIFCCVLGLNSAFATCPANQSTFSMTYPAKVIFLSENSRIKEPQIVPGIFATAILKEFGIESPKIVFSGTAKTFSLVKKIAVKSVDVAVVNSRLSLFETKPAQFQQDVFESFSQENGKSILIRPFQGYAPENGGPDLEKMASLLDRENIKVKMGPVINQQGAWLTGVGGNIESTSFGLNLLGSGEFSKEKLQLFAEGLFTHTKSTIFFDTSWLALGHIDEVLVEVQANHTGSECESIFLINSPRLGLQYDKNPQKLAAEINHNLQKKFDSYKDQLVSASNSLCKIKFVEVPMIYKKAPLFNHRVVYATKYPSLTNGLLIKNRYFVVEINNQRIKKSFEKSLKEIGLKVVWLPLQKNLFSEGLVDGYAHCLTNSIRGCQ